MPMVRKLAEVVENPKTLDPWVETLVRAGDRDVERRTKYQGARESFTEFVATVGRDRQGYQLRFDAYSHILHTTLEHCYADGDAAKQKHLYHVKFPGLGGSTIARYFACYQLGLNNDLNIVFSSSAKKPAQKAVSECREIITRTPNRSAKSISTPLYMRIFPSVRPDYERSMKEGHKGWRQDEFFIQTTGHNPDAAMEAVPVDTKTEARRVDIFIADDVMTRAIAESENERPKYVEAFNKTWIEGRLANGGWCFGLQNCWHPDDLGHLIRRDATFCSLWFGVDDSHECFFVRLFNPPPDLPLIRYPHEFEAKAVDPKDAADYEFHVPFPADDKLYNKAKFDGMYVSREDKEGNRFTQTYYLQAQQSSDLMFPSFKSRVQHPMTAAELWGFDHDERGLPIVRDSMRHNLVFGGGWDMSGVGRPGDAFVIFAKRPDGTKGPIETWRGKFSMMEMMRIIDDAWQRGIHCSVLHVESNGVQAKLTEAIRGLGEIAEKEWWRRIRPFFTTSQNKNDWMIGLRAMDPQFEHGEIIWPAAEAKRLDDIGKAWRMLAGEMTTCPKILKPGQTPDGPMALWFAERAVALNKSSPPPPTRKRGRSELQRLADIW